MEMLLVLIILFSLLVLRVPVAFSMAISASVGLLLTGVPLDVVPQRLFGSLNSFSLLAVPLFILVGELMNIGGITERIFAFASSFVGHVPGGLGHVNVVSSIIFAGMSGSAVSDTYGLGLIEIKAMKEKGFDSDFSAAVTAASSAIGPIIPPSIPLVVYAFVVEQSVGKLFLGGVFPGLLMGISLMVLVFVISKRKHYKTEQKTTLKQKLNSTISAIPALLTPVILFSGIAFGIVTPTEGAMLAVIYAIILGFIIYKEYNLRTLYQVILKTVINSASILILVASASILAWIILTSDFPEVVERTLLYLSGNNRFLVLLFINVILLLMGCFLEGISIIFIMTAVLMPTLTTFNIDMIHFGLILVLNIMIGIITPPFGLALFIVTDIAEIPFEATVKAVLPFLVPLIMVLLIITYIPDVVTFLPNIVYGR